MFYYVTKLIATCLKSKKVKSGINKMSSLGWLIVFFFFLCFLVVLVYALVVRSFYWGDKKEPPDKK
jgi:Na+/H+-dicarboxylate symporter